MKRIFYTLILSTGLLMTACSDNESGENPPPPSPSDRTVIIYQSAQNSLGYDQFHRSDSAEIVQGASYMGKNDRVLLYMDDANNPRIYLITRNTVVPKLVYRSQTDDDSSSPTTLSNVLKWCKTNYPSSSYGLVLWSHADGWLPPALPNKTGRSFGVDVGPGGSMYYDKDKYGNIGSQMKIEDLAAALEDSKVYFDYIFFDACLMQCLESGYTLRNTTDYIIAGPIIMPAIGANYFNLMKNGFFAKTPSTAIAESYFKFMKDEARYPYNDFGLVISTVKTAGLDSLARITAEVLPQATETYPDMSQIQRYADYRSSYGYAPEFYDAGQTMKALVKSSEDYLRWRAQLDRCITYKAATPSVYSYSSGWNEVFIPIDVENYTAVSMFVPQARYTTNAPICRYGDLNEAFRQTEWYTAAGWEQKGW